METKVMVNTKEPGTRFDFVSEAIVEEDGAIKWASNGRYLMKDTMRNIIANGFDKFSVEATDAKRDAQNEAFIREYKANQKAPSQEELAEMRNAFGAGTKVVDVISGRVVSL